MLMLLVCYIINPFTTS